MRQELCHQTFLQNLTMQAASPVTPQNMYRSPRKKHRNIRRIIRRMEKIKQKAKGPRIIAPFHPPTRNPDPAVFGNDLKSSAYAQSRPRLLCAALIDSRQRTFSASNGELRNRSDSNASSISMEHRAPTKPKMNPAAMVTSPLRQRTLKQAEIRKANELNPLDIQSIMREKKMRELQQYDIKLSPRNASLRHGIKHLPKKHLTVPRRHITTKTLNQKEDAKPYTWLYPADEKFDLERYKSLYLHYQDWRKPSWISHRIYVPNKSTFKPGTVVNVAVNSGIPPGEFDLRPYKKLYRKKLADEKRKLSIFKKKGKLWQKVDKSPVLGKNQKKEGESN